MHSDLLPAPDATPLCSTFSRQLGIRPAGTGLTLDRVVVVATPLPWPKPALKHPLLQRAAQRLSGSNVRSRLFAAEPWSDEQGIAVELYERRGLEFALYRWLAADEHELAELIAWIGDSAIGAIDAAPSVVAPTLLVCTQGSHDQCCGVFGEELAKEIERSRPGVVVRRVSHTGGHRFAPTLLAIPSGRMWAFVDEPLVDRIVAGTETDDDLRTRCRGWLGAPSGVAQVAEIAARIHQGRQPGVEPQVEVVPNADASAEQTCVVHVGETPLTVSVRVTRTVPTIKCAAPGGLPAKEAIEYDWQIEVAAWS